MHDLAIPPGLARAALDTLSGALATTAMAAIDTMLAELHSARSGLLAEIRASDDATDAHVERAAGRPARRAASHAGSANPGRAGRGGHVMTGPEPTLDDVAAMFPHWHVWRGIAGLVYARKPLMSPPVVLRGEDPADLRDQIRGWLGRQP